MEKKEFINYFLKYGADSSTSVRKSKYPSITDALVRDYKQKREDNFKTIINGLDDTQRCLEEGFL